MELNLRVKEHAADAARGFLSRVRDDNSYDLLELHKLLERFYRYGLEDRD